MGPNLPLFSICFLLSIPDISIGRKQKEPEIISTATTLQLQKGKKAIFECGVENLGDRHIVWRRGYDVLATESIVLSPDPRISVHTDRTTFYLTIESIQNQDIGQYVCQISTTSGSSNLVSVEHSLDILVPARILSNSDQTYLTIQEGEEALLQCQVAGNPHPTVIWTKEGSSHQLPGVQCDGGHCVQITGVQQRDGGAYKCTASNGVGESSSASIFLTVQYKPRIKPDQTNKNYVLENRELTLECIIESEPAPTVAWYKGNTQMTAGQKLHFKRTGSSYKLIIKERPPMVFGNYSCQAENLLGESRKFFEVHGRPYAAKFKPNQVSYQKHRYELGWSVESSVPILEYRLLYRRLAKAGLIGKYEGEDWTNVIIPGTDQDSISNTKTMSWDLEGLQEESSYEAIVQARNMYGWSEPSSMFSFNTSIPVEKQGGVTYSLNWSLDSQSGQIGLTPNIIFILITSMIALFNF